MELRSQVTVGRLKEAFALAEDRLRHESNLTITQVITNEVSSTGGHEGLVNAVIAKSLHDVFCADFVVETEVKRIDICVLDSHRRVVAAIEGKAMVSNSHRADRYSNSLDVHGIRTKLHSNKQSSNSVEKDVLEVENKIASVGPVIRHHEIFVPIVYELYRKGGEDEWTKESKPWTTHDKYLKARKFLKRDFNRWFSDRYPGQFKPLHCTEPIELIGADRLWRKQSGWRYPRYESLKAYVSFYAFRRFVGN